ncbi:MAG: hypothetical protein AAGL29_08820 [Bacteroidota bacterium]
MNWIKNRLKPKDKPFYDKSACEAFFGLYESPSIEENIKIYRVLREIRHKGRDLCSIDYNLKYTYQFRNGNVREIDLKKTGRRKSARKLFERMEANIDEIKKFSSSFESIAKDDIVLYTYLTSLGTYQDAYELNKPLKKGISAYVATTFWNYVDLVDPNRQKRILKVLKI